MVSFIDKVENSKENKGDSFINNQRGESINLLEKSKNFMHKFKRANEIYKRNKQLLQQEKREEKLKEKDDSPSECYEQLETKYLTAFNDVVTKALWKTKINRKMRSLSLVEIEE